jgi:hypothetical protein
MMEVKPILSILVLGGLLSSIFLVPIVIGNFRSTSSSQPRQRVFDNSFLLLAGLGFFLLWSLVPWVLFYSDRGTYLQFVDRFLVHIALVIISIFMLLDARKRR